MKLLIRIGTHLAALAIGFVLGVYFLPILIAPEPPAASAISSTAASAQYAAEFTRDLEDSDALHWGEGTLFVGADSIAFEGELAPGPDYRLYLSPTFVETESEFLALKSSMVEIGAVQTFENFMVAVPASVDVSAYSTAIVWCEAFGQFITAGEYQASR